MPSRKIFPLGLDKFSNPLEDNLFFTSNPEGASPPPGSEFIVTEDNVYIVTETGDFIVTESA